MDAPATDFVNTVSLATELANRFEARGSGCPAVIGSVAGDRGCRIPLIGVELGFASDSPSMSSLHAR